MKIVIAGSAGFIGNYLTDALENEGQQTIPFDLSINIDVCNWNQIKEVNDFDAIVHLANKSFVPDSYKYPREFHVTNIIGTLNLLELCRMNNAKFIYLSSYVYGRPEYLPIDEKHPLNAFNPYAQTKVICEEMCRGYNRDFNVPVTIFRPFNIYGFGQNNKFLIPEMIQQALSGKIIIKDERPKRDYIHVKDVVNAIMASLRMEQKKDFSLYNLGSGISHSVRDLGSMIINAMDRETVFSSSGEERPNEVMDTIADIRKAKKYLKWEPEIRLAEGIKEMISFYQ
jgi:nucleoside-diphosphate-sugar epimerase